jgi:hypothetical protein
MNIRVVESDNPFKEAAPWTVQKLTKSVAKIIIDASEVRSGRILLQSDEHFDNTHCVRELLLKHHDEAIIHGAPIIKVGDTFCAMQGKWDRRSDQSQLRPEHRVNNYLDSLVGTAGEFYGPFARQIAVITPGNHESSIAKHHQTDLTARLIDELNSKYGGSVVGLTYASFVRVVWRWGGGNASSKTILLNHGFGGGGPVTRGMIDNNRTAVQYHADVYVSGHIHRRNMDENVILRLSPKDTLETATQWFIRCGTYKTEHVGMEGYHTEKGRAARPLGGVWLQWDYERAGNRQQVKLIPIPA